MVKQRLDQALVELGLASTRSQAQGLIMAGQCLVDGRRADKSGFLVKADQEVALKNAGPKYVSRGALKLLHGLEHFELSPLGLNVVDIGASTGGFTEVLLEKGALNVWAVDVGHGQLAWKLRQDERVSVLEKTNARYLSKEQIGNRVDAVVCDASFISLKKVLPAALSMTGDCAWCCALIKPQFEAGRSQVGKGGVVRDDEVRQSVCTEIAAWFSSLKCWQVLGVTQSPILGPSGNAEFLIAARKSTIC